MNRPPQNNILYYSNRCINSQKFLNSLKRGNLVSSFTLIDIDIPNNRKQLPRSITSVPTIYIHGMNRHLVGNEAFFWLQLELNKSGPSSNQSSTTPTSSAPTNSSIQDILPEGDANFSFLDNSLSHAGTFSYLGTSDCQITSPSLQALDDNNNGRPSKLSSSDYEAYINARDAGINQGQIRRV